MATANANKSGSLAQAFGVTVNTIPEELRKLAEYIGSPNMDGTTLQEMAGQTMAQVHTKPELYEPLMELLQYSTEVRENMLAGMGTVVTSGDLQVSPQFTTRLRKETERVKYVPPPK